LWVVQGSWDGVGLDKRDRREGDREAGWGGVERTEAQQGVEPGGVGVGASRQSQRADAPTPRQNTNQTIACQIMTGPFGKARAAVV
jgi:hypothetical protein